MTIEKLAEDERECLLAVAGIPDGDGVAEKALRIIDALTSENDRLRADRDRLHDGWAKADVSWASALETAEARIDALTAENERLRVLRKPGKSVMPEMVAMRMLIEKAISQLEDQGTCYQIEHALETLIGKAL